MRERVRVVLRWANAGWGCCWAGLVLLGWCCLSALLARFLLHRTTHRNSRTAVTTPPILSIPPRHLQILDARADMKRARRRRRQPGFIGDQIRSGLITGSSRPRKARTRGVLWSYNAIYALGCNEAGGAVLGRTWHRRLQPAACSSAWMPRASGARCDVGHSRGFCGTSRRRVVYVREEAVVQETQETQDMHETSCAAYARLWLDGIRYRFLRRDSCVAIPANPPSQLHRAFYSLHTRRQYGCSGQQLFSSCIPAHPSSSQPIPAHPPPMHPCQ